MPAISILDQIRTSAEYAKTHAKYVKIDEEALKNFAAGLDLDKIRSSARPAQLPLRFNSPEHKINFYALLDLINFGSGFRHECHKYCGQGAYQTILYGLMNMVISGAKLDTNFMNSLTLTDIAAHFNIKMDADVPHPTIGAMYVSQPTPVRPLAELIHKVIADSGRILAENQCRDFAEFIRKALTPPLAPAGEAPTADRLIQALRRSFPAFNDVGKLADGTEVFLMKKAQLLAADLYNNFKDSAEHAYLHFVDYNKLTVFVDNVLPAVLRTAGVIKLQPELEEKINQRKPIKAGPIEAELRAVTIAACEDIVDAVGRDKLTAADLDYYLWDLGKKEGYRTVERHATKDTIFY